MSLRVSGVAHRYGNGPIVLVDVDLEVEADDTLAIVGPSGSGKTTLLSIMGGLLQPTEGEVVLDGFVVGREELPSGSLSWIFQTINLLGRRTALDNVALGLLALGYSVDEARERARTMLETVGLRGLEDRPAMTLSGGEAQRVGVARALVGRPRYVLTDEPTGQLDRSTSLLVADALFTARPAGTAIVVASHDPLLADRCRRRYELVDGRLRALS
ncbi:MAG: ABC transporter ATP-binding protein [Chloroflexota bacterium]|nr:MAG: ABC transporter ATP-binding protein [Chloroflexota bacterium]